MSKMVGGSFCNINLFHIEFHRITEVSRKIDIWNCFGRKIVGWLFQSGWVWLIRLYVTFDDYTWNKFTFIRFMIREKTNRHQHLGSRFCELRALHIYEPSFAIIQNTHSMSLLKVLLQRKKQREKMYCFLERRLIYHSKCHGISFKIQVPDYAHNFPREP